MLRDGARASGSRQDLTIGIGLPIFVGVSLRVDNRIEFMRLPWSIPRMFSGRYALVSGRRIVTGNWKRIGMEAILTQQREMPVRLCQDGPRRVLWHFHDCFYWEDDGLGADDVRVLVLERERRKDQKLRNAHSIVRAEAAGKSTRVPIPDAMRRIVFERDGGRCVECDSNFNIQYDHILPVALGGATTVENLQILCADCNRRKSATI